MSALLECDDLTIEQVSKEFDASAARLREIEEYEISKLASHVVGPNTLGWADIFCGHCEANTCTRGTARKLAEKVFAMDWLVIDSNPMCPRCQNPELYEGD